MSKQPKLGTSVANGVYLISSSFGLPPWLDSRSLVWQPAAFHSPDIRRERLDLRVGLFRPSLVEYRFRKGQRSVDERVWSRHGGRLIGGSSISAGKPDFSNNGVGSAPRFHGNGRLRLLRDELFRFRNRP